ncbi:HTH-type transcriptional activator RhaR [bioreactor metagenome]|uniref:HTH-type transcriptional activator RhaR n=1 Tax=bioreactor metagenome TaxID=1076179 RepID=A0A645IEE4_9ZZZZ
MWQLLIQHNREKIETCRRISFENRIKIRKMVSCIQANHAEPLTLKDIADSIHISRSECCRLFRRVLDLTPFEYLIQYRISQSLMYLSSTDLCISDIAQQVGFGSSSYFTECFKREMGQSPVKYRKSLMTRMGETDRPS